jgi:small subunit ribosomal protein S18
MSEEIKNIDTDNPAEITEEPVSESVQGKKVYISQDESGERSYQRNLRFKRKVCRYCHDKNARIDYKDVKMVEQFITDRGKILPRRVTGICAKHQRGVALAIKRARIIALIPFVEK